MDLALEKVRTMRRIWEKMRFWIRVLSFMWVRVEDDDGGDDLFMSRERLTIFV